MFQYFSEYKLIKFCGHISFKVQNFYAPFNRVHLDLPLSVRLSIILKILWQGWKSGGNCVLWFCQFPVIFLMNVKIEVFIYLIDEGAAQWSRIKSCVILLCCATLIALCADLIAENIQDLLTASGISEVGLLHYFMPPLYLNSLLSVLCI